MKGLISILLVLFSLHSSISQTRVKLKYDPADKYMPYSFLNSSDTSFIEIGFNEDMGVRSNFFYFFKITNRTPDGAYEIYVNGRLGEKLFVKEQKLDSTDITYFSNGDIAILTTYRLGLKEGPFRKYSKTKKLIDSADYTNGHTFIYTFFSKKGKVIGRAFYLPNMLYQVRWENYNGKGVIQAIINNSHEAHLMSSAESYPGGILNGHQSLYYEVGHFDLWYKKNVLLKWKFYDENDKLLAESKDQLK